MAIRVAGLFKSTRSLMAAARTTASTPKPSSSAAAAAAVPPPLVFEINLTLTLHSNGQLTSTMNLPNNPSLHSVSDSKKESPVKSPATVRRRTPAGRSENVDDNKTKEVAQDVINEKSEGKKRVRSTGEVLRRPGGTQKAFPVSAALGGFLGVGEASRNDALRKVWDHIKLQKLQTPGDKMVIVCDDKLKTIFEGKDKLRFQEIPKLLTHHFVKAG